MGLLDEYVVVAWVGTNKVHLESKGYIYTKKGDKVEVKVEDLDINACVKVNIECDICGNRKFLPYRNYINNIKNNAGKYNCVKHCHSYYEKIFKSEGYILLSEYKNNRQKLDLICPNGHKIKMNYDCFSRGVRCRNCYYESKKGKYKLSIEEVRNILENENYTLLSEDYQGVHSKIKYQCSNGHINEQVFSDFQQGYRCKKCAEDKASERYRFDYNFVKNEFEKRGYKLASTDYKNMDHKLKFICPNGHEGEMTFASFYKNNCDCFDCGLLKLKGENHHNWNPEITDEERENKRRSEEYSLWTKTILEKYNYTCYSCLKVGGDMASHHLNGYHWAIDERFLLDNGVALCSDCHREFHNLFGYKYNTREQFIEFMTIKNKELSTY